MIAVLLINDVDAAFSPVNQAEELVVSVHANLSA